MRYNFREKKLTRERYRITQQKKGWGGGGLLVETWQVRDIFLFEYKRGLLVERILKERKNSCLEEDNKILTINKLYIRSI